MAQQARKNEYSASDLNKQKTNQEYQPLGLEWMLFEPILAWMLIHRDNLAKWFIGKSLHNNVWH